MVCLKNILKCLKNGEIKNEKINYTNTYIYYIINLLTVSNYITEKDIENKQ